MRLIHLFVAVFLTALMLTAARDLVGRVALVVFFIGSGEFVVGTIAVMTLFKTIGSIGYAKGIVACAQAVFATLMVLAVATIVMHTLLIIGIRVIQLVAVQ
jgi:hypothetical protein